ncbi:hypothetical protein GCM10010343_39260 [Streptomyces avidinii]|nr:hypothetical protein GCM10010343_39260 [Streptomyces avidinii]
MDVPLRQSATGSVLDLSAKYGARVPPQRAGVGLLTASTVRSPVQKRSKKADATLSPSELDDEMAKAARSCPGCRSCHRLPDAPVDPDAEEQPQPWAGMQVTSGCFSMEVGSDVSLSTEVSAMTLPARRRTGGPVEPDAFFGRTHQFFGAPRTRHTPLQQMRVPGHAPLGGEERGRRYGSGRQCAHGHHSQGASSHGTGRETASVNLCERTAAPISSVCSERGRAQRAVRREGVSATTWVPR